jgi:hypothetical protein
LRDKQAPAYLQEFIRLLAENPISVDMSTCVTRNDVGLRKRRAGGAARANVANLPPRGDGFTSTRNSY